MIIKQPKSVSKTSLKKRKKRRSPRWRYVEVEPMPYELVFSPKFWKRLVIGSRFSMELVPLLYRLIQDRPNKTYYRFCDGEVMIHATFDGKTILLEDIRPMTLPRAKLRIMGYHFLFPTCVMRMGKDKHFFKRWAQRRFALSLLVPLYEEIKRSMPGDKISVSDGTYKLMGYKANGMLAIAGTGVVLGEIDWDEYLDKKFR